MSTNVIKQTLVGEPGMQTIKQIVRSNERGPQGPQGEPGEAGTITAGNAYSVPAGQAPAVINTGTSTDAVFDFYIPRGDKGDKGDQGKDGAIAYIAGTGIRIKDNIISAIGGGGGDVEWGDIKGTLSDQVDLQTALSQFVPADDFATVAFTGDYANLVGKPTIPAAQVQSDWNQTINTEVDYIKNKPTIPAAQIQSDWTQANTTSLDYIKNKPNLATVATSGSYNDLINQPTIPTITVTGTDPGEGAALSPNNFIAVYSV